MCEDCPVLNKDLFLCVECAFYMDPLEYQPPALEEAHDLKQLFYVMNEGAMHGPATKSEIISLFVRKFIQPTKLQITDCCYASDWVKLQFPKAACDKFDKHDKERHQEIQRVSEANSEFKEKHRDLYKALVEDVMFGKMECVFEAKPPDEDDKSFVALAQSIVGKCIGVLVLALIVVHAVPFLICLCFCLVPLWCLIPAHTRGPPGGGVFMLVMFFLIPTYACGMLITPIVTVLLLLSHAGEWDEIQSWMVVYIAWGVFSFVLTSLLVLGGVLDSPLLIHAFSEIINIALGIDFGQTDVNELLNRYGNTFLISAVMFALPCVASFLPAAICGFIANFAWEPRYALKCSVDTLSGDICFDDNEGCCEVISSHEWESSYSFVGSLTSNILATWAIIRFCGYLFIQGLPVLAMYAARKK